MINSVVAVGTFDGLHRGHQYLINKLLAAAESRKMKSIVVALSSPVKQVAGVLSTVREKEMLLAQFPVDEVVMLPNTADIINQPAQEFLSEFLIKKLRARELVVGHDFAFGKGRRGDIKWIQDEAEKRNMRLSVVKPVTFGKKIISSTLIRKLVAEGDIQTANKLLGSFYFINAKPVKGRGIGTKLGFPTINLIPEKAKLLPHGVFTAWCSSSKETFPAVVNIGSRPTFFSDAVVVIEIHLLNSNINWKSNNTSVYLSGKLRNELKFNSPAELVKQINADVAKSKQYFGLA